MTDKHILKVQPRQITGKKVSQLRNQGIAVGSISTPAGKSISIQFQQKTVGKLLSEVGESSLIYLKVEDEKSDRPVLLDEVQLNPITEELYHVAFRQVSLKEKVTAEIPVELVGEVDIPNTTVMLVKDSVEVSALPTDLPEKFEVSISGLSEAGQTITAADLAFDTSKISLILPEEQTAEEVTLVVVQELKEETEETETPEAGSEATEAAAQATEAAGESAE